MIANNLTEHGVPFRYEQPYRVDTATKRHCQYRPDFYLPESDVYIEQFAIGMEKPRRQGRLEASDSQGVPNQAD